MRLTTIIVVSNVVSFALMDMRAFSSCQNHSIQAGKESKTENAGADGPGIGAGRWVSRDQGRFRAVLDTGARTMREFGPGEMGAMRFASIDVGSNAVRLLLSQVYADGGPAFFKKDSLVRFPLRLGDDAFLKHRISEVKVRQFVRVMVAFRHLIDAYEPLAYRACATSAMREAENRAEIIRAVREACGIELEVIPGRTEAEIIFANHSERDLDTNATYLYIDVGGGSTQLTLFSEGRSAASRSFDIGAIRILEELVPRETWREMQAWVKEASSAPGPVLGIGSGGNINKIFLLAGNKTGKPVSAKKLKEVDRILKKLSVEDRVRQLALRPDRADVIVPALKIFRRVMKWADIRKLYVPFIGLSDGLIHQLYEKYVQEGAGPQPLPVRGLSPC
jgi:exopolyphosphatase/guanosine-5'-triphosphate,3'-diphosphate pyrophosphatase